MLDHGQHPRRHKPCTAHDPVGSGQLLDLHRRPAGLDFDLSPRAACYNFVFLGRAAAGVDQDLDTIALRHLNSNSPPIRRLRIESLAQLRAIPACS
jgi:hypothetical protein